MCFLSINPADGQPGCLRGETPTFDYRTDINMSESWRAMTRDCTGKFARCANPLMGHCLYCMSHPVKDRCPLQWKPGAVASDGKGGAFGCAAVEPGGDTCAGCFLCFLNANFRDGCHSTIGDRRAVLKHNDCKPCRACKHCAPKRSTLFKHRLIRRRMKHKAARDRAAAPAHKAS